MHNLVQLRHSECASVSLLCWRPGAPTGGTKRKPSVFLLFTEKKLPLRLDGGEQTHIMSPNMPLQHKHTPHKPNCFIVFTV